MKTKQIFSTGQVWYPENPVRPGRKITFTHVDLPGPWMRGLIGDHQQVAFIVVDRNGCEMPLLRHTENEVIWHSRIMIETFRAWVRKNKATLFQETP